MSVPWNPLPHQKKAMRWMLTLGAGGLLLDPGLGKTSITYGAFKILKAKHYVNRLLVIAPLRPAQLVWPAEAEKWTDFKDLRIVVLHSSFGNMDELARLDADVFVINPEGLQWFVDNRIAKIIEADMLVVDESSKFKHSNTKRFQLLKSILHRYTRRYILTGSPMPNGYIDLFGQMYILDLGSSFGPFITHYRTKYFYPSGFGGFSWLPQEGAIKKIQEAIKPIALRMEAEDYIVLPELTIQNIYVDMPAAARKIYKSMEDELFALLDKGERVEAVNVAASIIKCRQIANGNLYGELKPGTKTKETIAIHTAKLDALEDLVSELNGSPLLVGYQFEHDLVALRARFGKDIPYIGKGVPLARLREIEKDWNAGLLQYLFGHPAAIGHGLNLQGAGNHVAWYGLTWDFEQYDQFIRRVLRQGNTHKRVFVYHLVARNTIESAMQAALLKKKLGQKEFLDALKDYRKKKAA